MTASLGVHRRRLSATLLALAVLGGAACSSPQPDVTVTDSGNGGRVSVSVGQVLDIVLHDNYSTSKAQWRSEPAQDDILNYLGSKYEPDKPPPGSTDVGVFTARYKAVKRGTVSVALVQEDNATPPRVVNHFSVDVTVS
ncbi:protease inhibitor I42 family protein (plasmid) [Mycolicibacterium aichiense]|uniref:protease inhibitor I42 family protein n=1 Tax=Mycolicibacterium aichiense TaxID=1799 RepID=UPI003D67F783